MPWPRRLLPVFGAVLTTLSFAPLPSGLAARPAPPSPVAPPAASALRSFAEDAERGGNLPEPGAHGAAVVVLQELLQGVGFHLPVDGTYRAATAADVARLDERLGLPESGRLDPRSALALLRLAARVHLGSRGLVAEVLAERLEQPHPAAPLSAATLNALRAFAIRHHLPPLRRGSLAVLLLLLGLPDTVPTDVPVASAPRSEVLGYYTAWPGSGSYASFLQHAHLLTEIAPLWFSITPEGDVVVWPGVTDIAALTRLAHADGKKVLAIVTNAGGNARILVNPAVRARAVQNLVATVEADHLDGVNIDFELIDGWDAYGLTRFVAETAALLAPRGLLTTVAVGPRTSSSLPLADASAAYDYRALGEVADRVVLMTYDEHDNGSSPGPIAGIAWVRRVLRYALREIPADKILLGVADYGYDWAGPGNGVSLQSGQAEALAAELGVPIRWDAAAEEPYFTYRSAAGIAHTVFFEDGASLAFKLHLVLADHLAGIAIWSLGHEDPAYFPTIAALLHVAP